MRVIAGKYKGRKLLCPPGVGVRPTGDRIKETLFSLLTGEIEGAAVLDLFAGVGALGIEALSRGAHSAVFVERDGLARSFLSRNLESVGAEDEAAMLGGDAFRAMRRLSDDGRRFDIVFADPPYGRNIVYRLLALQEDYPLCGAGGMFVLQHHSKEDPGEAANLEICKRREVGDTVLSLYRAR